MNLRLGDIDKLDWQKQDGLLPAIVHDVRSGAVLMLGWMNREALRTTLDRRRVVFFSRSKQRLWEKGETSGNTLALERIVMDCDRDTLLIGATPHGPSCHTGTRTCFGDEPQSAAEQLVFLHELEQVIDARMSAPDEGSYTARLAASGARRVAQKVGEEGLEVALAGASQNDAELRGEAADLLYHLLVLLRVRGLSLGAVVSELQERHRSKTVKP